MMDSVALLFSHWLGQMGRDGVNAIAASIPRKNIIVGEPDYPAPPLVTVVNDVEDKDVAASLDPPVVPALVVWGDSDAELALVKGYPIAKKVRIAAAFVTAEDADALTAIRDCGFILRAARVSMFVRYNKQSLSEDYRALNGVKVLEISSVTEKRIAAAVGHRKLWGFLDISATVVETIT
jgi:hypothetical protein